MPHPEEDNFTTCEKVAVGTFLISLVGWGIGVGITKAVVGTKIAKEVAVVGGLIIAGPCS